MRRQTGSRPEAGAAAYSGDHKEGATPVPIPNTAVKPFLPMVLAATGRVGYRPNFIHA